MRRRLFCSLFLLALLSAWLARPLPADMVGGFGLSAAAGGVSSGTAALEPDNAVVSSSTLLEITAWDTVALAPIFSSTLTYDAALGTLPAAQGWSRDSDANESVVGGELLLDVDTGVNLSAVYSVAAGDHAQGALRIEGLRLVNPSAVADEMIQFQGGDQRIVMGATNRSIGLRSGPLRSVVDPDSSVFRAVDDVNFSTAGTLEIRYARQSVAAPTGLVEYRWNGVKFKVHRRYSELANNLFTFEGYGGLTGGGGQVRLTRVRGVTGTPYSAASPTADVVIDLGAGNTGTWDMSTILSDERGGAGALRYRYEAGASDPGASDPLNGSDLSLTAIRTEGDPSGRFLRFRVVFPSDGTVLQPRAWGGGSIAWTVP